VQNFAERNLKMVGFVYIREELKFTSINLQKYCKEHDMEIVAIQIKLIGYYL
jgi:hypothetical protein